MRNALNISWRDIRSVFVSPIAYVVLTGFVLLAGWFFFNLLGQFNRYVGTYASMQGYDSSWLNLNDAVIAGATALSRVIDLEARADGVECCT